MVERFKYKIEPMDLENMRQNGVRSLDIQCLQCLHRVILNAARFAAKGVHGLLLATGPNAFGVGVPIKG